MSDDSTELSGWTALWALGLLALGAAATYTTMSGPLMLSIVLSVLEAAGIILFVLRARRRAREKDAR